MVRKLIRPSLRRVLEKQVNDKVPAPEKDKGPIKPSDQGFPAERTYKEVEYYQELIKKKTSLLIKLKDGRTIEGYLEYYDSIFLRITCKNSPNVFIFKKDIKYFYEKPFAEAEA